MNDAFLKKFLLVQVPEVYSQNYFLEVRAANGTKFTIFIHKNEISDIFILKNPQK